MALVMGRARKYTSDELPTPHAMSEWEAHGLLEARKVMEHATGDFSIIGAVVDNFQPKYVRNEGRAGSRRNLKPRS